MKRLYILLLFIYTASCSLNKYNVGNNFKGNYSHQYSLEGVTGFLKIGKKNKFSYKWQVGLLFGETKGIWKIINDSSIVLISTDLKPIQPIRNDSLNSPPPRYTITFESDTLVLVSSCLRYKNMLNSIGWCKGGVPRSRT